MILAIKRKEGKQNKYAKMLIANDDEDNKQQQQQQPQPNRRNVLGE